MPAVDVTMRELVQPLAAVFGDPRKGEPAAFYAALCDDLAGYSEAAVKAAMVEIRRGWKFWPSISECREAASKAATAMAATAPSPRASGWSEDAAVAFLRRKPMTARALAQGWHSGLVEFVQRNMREPKEPEAAHLRSISDAITARIDEGADHPMERSLSRAMLAKRNRLRERLEA